MTKKDLKTGMVVQTRNGCTYTVMLGAHTKHLEGDVLANHEGGFLYLSSYSNDMIELEGTHGFDIMKVFVATGYHSLMTFNCNKDKYYNLLWERCEEHTPVVGDVYEALHDKFVITRIDPDGKGLYVTYSDGSSGPRDMRTFVNCGYKFTGKNVARHLEILTNEVKDC